MHRNLITELLDLNENSNSQQGEQENELFVQSMRKKISQYEKLCKRIIADAEIKDQMIDELQGKVNK